MSGRVIVVGDAMLDVWQHYRTVRQSPEGGPIAEYERTDIAPGGALNVAAALADFDRHAVVFYSALRYAAHRDAAQLEAALKKRRVAFVNPFDSKLAEHAVTRKRRVVLDGKTLFRHDLDAPVLQTLSGQVLGSHFVSLDPAAVVLVDYAKGVLWPATLTTSLLFELRRLRDTWVVLDVKPNLLRWLTDVALSPTSNVIVKCNYHEWTAAMGKEMSLHEWQRKFPESAIVVTNPSGADWAAQGRWGDVETTPTPSRLAAAPPTVNVCGAGDVFTAHLVDTLLDGVDAFDEAVWEAATGASDAVWSGQLGTLRPAAETFV